MQSFVLTVCRLYAANVWVILKRKMVVRLVILIAQSVGTHRWMKRENTEPQTGGNKMSIWIDCPFFMYEASLKIRCEGGTREFGSKDEKSAYIRRYCASLKGCELCKHYKEMWKKYETQSSEKTCEPKQDGIPQNETVPRRGTAGKDTGRGKRTGEAVLSHPRNRRRSGSGKRGSKSSS